MQVSNLEHRTLNLERLSRQPAAETLLAGPPVEHISRTQAASVQRKSRLGRLFVRKSTPPTLLAAGARRKMRQRKRCAKRPPSWFAGKEKAMQRSHCAA